MFPVDLGGSFATLSLPMSTSAQLSGDLRHETYRDMTEAPQQRAGGRARGRGRGRGQPPPLHMGPVAGYAGLQ